MIFNQWCLVKRMVAPVLISMVFLPTLRAQILIAGAGATVTVQDLEQDIQRVPPDLRAKTFSDPQVVQNIVSNMFVRRVLAVEAVNAGLDQDPQVKAALVSARERILSDVRLANIDQSSQPTLDALQAYAKSAYKANPQRFNMPEEIRVSHILIRTVESDARAKAETLLTQLKAGASFEELATTRSQDPGSASKGGDLGFQARGSLVKPFEDAAFKLERPGEISDIVETQFGFHILKFLEKRSAGIRSFEEVGEVLLKEAQAKLVSDGRSAAQNRILTSAKIDVAGIEAFTKTQVK